jgi:hypothetical protein
VGENVREVRDGSGGESFPDQRRVSSTSRLPTKLPGAGLGGQSTCSSSGTEAWCMSAGVSGDGLPGAVSFFDGGGLAFRVRCVDELALLVEGDVDVTATGLVSRCRSTCARRSRQLDMNQLFVHLQLSIPYHSSRI